MPINRQPQNQIERDITTATFISLITETQWGEKHIGGSVGRATRFREQASKFGVQVTGIYWTLGEYDGVLVFEAAKDEEAAAFLHYVASKGTVRPHTMRAFDVEATQSVLKTIN